MRSSSAGGGGHAAYLGGVPGTVLEACCAVSLSHSRFHTDNGSEFINKTLAKLLDKLLIERPRASPHSGDNGLVETKRCGDPQTHRLRLHPCQPCDSVNDFYRQYLNPYLELSTVPARKPMSASTKGRKRICYKRYRTPLETLLELHQRHSICVKDQHRRPEAHRGALTIRTRRAACNKQKPVGLKSCGSPRRTGSNQRRRNERSWKSLREKAPTAFPRTLEIDTTDSHIPSARLRR